MDRENPPEDHLYLDPAWIIDRVVKTEAGIRYDARCVLATIEFGDAISLRNFPTKRRRKLCNNENFALSVSVKVIMQQNVLKFILNVW
jgi:hypothetical protein